MLIPSKDQEISAHVPSPSSISFNTSIGGWISIKYSRPGPQAGAWSSGKLWSHKCLILTTAPIPDSVKPKQPTILVPRYPGLMRKPIKQKKPIANTKILCRIQRGQGSRPIECSIYRATTRRPIQAKETMQLVVCEFGKFIIAIPLSWTVILLNPRMGKILQFGEKK